MTTAVKRNPGRPPKASAQSIPTTPKTRVRKRDRMRAAARSRTFGLSTITLVGAAALGTLGYLGLRKLDADRLKADPAARPLTNEISDRAGTTLAAVRDMTSKVASDIAGKTAVIAGDVKDRAKSIASDVSERAAGTVHELRHKASAITQGAPADVDAGTDDSRRQA